MSSEPDPHSTPDYEDIVLWPDDEETRMVFKPIPPGEFWMGSRGHKADEEPRHRVAIPAPAVERLRKGDHVLSVPAFWMAQTPVTQAQFGRWTRTDEYQAWFEANKGKIEFGPEGPHQNQFGPDPRLPAESLMWFEAQAFCSWLGEQHTAALALGAREEGGQPWRAMVLLPSEAQWEYACRAGSTTEYSSGDGEGALREVGWFDGNGGEETHPVRELAPNALGLYDMHGNVDEWCQDARNEAPFRARLDRDEARCEDRDSSARRVVRGGSWGSPARWCRSAYRDRWLPGVRGGNLGCRLLLLPGPGIQPGQRGAVQQP
jgi:formylglycine-generating enzyme required for sulfatase activity